MVREDDVEGKDKTFFTSKNLKSVACICIPLLNKGGQILGYFFVT